MERGRKKKVGELDKGGVKRPPNDKVAACVRSGGRRAAWFARDGESAGKTKSLWRPKHSPRDVLVRVGNKKKVKPAFPQFTARRHSSLTLVWPTVGRGNTPHGTERLSTHDAMGGAPAALLAALLALASGAAHASVTVTVRLDFERAGMGPAPPGEREVKTKPRRFDPPSL